MLTFKKSQLEAALMQLSIYDKETNKLIGGLLSESLTIGTKRRLNKIHSKLSEHYNELIKDYEELKNECKDNQDKLKNELKELLEETVQIDIEPVPFTMIENVSTSSNYNFDIIEKFTI